jgi:hypothetical protein
MRRMFKPLSLALSGQRWPLAVGLLALPAALWAQGPAPAAATDWRRANEAVAQFPRGHADVLKWEQAQPPAPLPTPSAQPATAVALPTPAHAARRAWLLHRDLAAVQARAGADAVEALAQGQWDTLDARLLRRVHGLGELTAVATQARKAWLNAVAAQQVLQPLVERAEAADAAFELGQRMVAVGNWSALQLTPVQLAKAAAHRELARARYAAAQSQHQLLALLPPAEGWQANGMATAQVDVPSALPDLPAQPLPDTAVAQRLTALQGQWPQADSLRHATARLALAAHRASWAVAQGYRDDVLPTRQRITDETQLRYNGMLKSVWDLLTETGNQAQARVDAIGAQRDAWLALTDLHWVLQGGLPDKLVTLGGGGADAPAGGAAH